MKAVLKKSACKMLDASISRKFSRITLVPRPTGIYIKAHNAARTVAVEHYMDRMLMHSYSGDGDIVCMPRIRFSVPGAEQLAMHVTGAVLEMVWKGTGISLKRNVYLLEEEETHPACTVEMPRFTFDYDVIYSLIHEGGDDLEISIGEKDGWMRRLHSEGDLLCVSKSMHSSTPCTAIIEKKDLENYIPHSPFYNTISISVHRNGIVVFSFEEAGTVTSIYIASDVLFL